MVKLYLVNLEIGKLTLRLKQCSLNHLIQLSIAHELKKFGFSRIYIADLDAIEGNNSNLKIAGEINKIIPVMFDSGIKNLSGVQKILDKVDKVIIATETIENFDDIELIFSSFPKQNLVLSVDIKDGNVLGKHIKADFEDILKKIEEIKPFEVILLDISRVGTENGVDHELIKSFIGLDTDLILGGGITLKISLIYNHWVLNTFLLEQLSIRDV